MFKIINNLTAALGLNPVSAIHNFIDKAQTSCHISPRGKQQDMFWCPGTLNDNSGIFIDEYVSLYHPREKFARMFPSFHGEYIFPYKSKVSLSPDCFF